MGIGTGTSTKTEYRGIAAADKANDATELYVWVSELIPFVKGELNALSIETPITTEGNYGGYSGVTNARNCIKAEYRPRNGLSALPPSVRRGEDVVVWCYSDTDTWYWDTDGRTEHLRRTDRKEITCNATADNLSEGGKANTYGVTINTREEYGKLGINIYTSNALGEMFRYVFSFNTTDGTVFLGDDAGNDLTIDSAEHRITLKNTDNSMLQLDKTNIILACTGDISIISKEQNIQLNAKQNVTSTSGQMTKVVAGTELITESTNDTKMTSKASMSVDVAQNHSTTVKGNTSITTKGNYDGSSEGNTSFSAKGNYSISTNGNFEVSAKGTGSISANGDLTLSSKGNVTNQAGGNINDAATGSWGISYAGGTCSGKGGHLKFAVRSMEIVES